MTELEVFYEVKDVIASSMSIDKSEVWLSCSLYLDLEVDEWGNLLDIAFSLTKRFQEYGIAISPDELQDEKMTVWDVVKLIRKKMQASPVV